MKRIGLFLGFVLCILVTYSQEEQFQKASKKNTIEAYNKFIIKYPDSKFIEEALFNIAGINNTIDSWDIFLSKYPYGKFAYVASDNFYKIIIKNNLVADYDRFLNRRPESKYTEEILFKKTVLINNADGWNSFLQKYPHCSFSWNAIGFYYEVVVKNNTVADYTAFLNTVMETKKYSEEIFYKRAILINTVESYNEYIIKYPQGKYANLIQKELFAINKERFQSRLLAAFTVCINPLSFNETATKEYSKKQLEELKKIIEDHINNLKYDTSKTNCNLIVEIEFSILSQWTRRSDGSWTEISIKYSFLDKQLDLVLINTYITKINDGGIIYGTEKAGNVIYTNLYASYDFNQTKKLITDFIVTIKPLEITDSTKFITLTDK